MHQEKEGNKEGQKKSVRVTLLKLAEALVTPLTVAIVGIIGSQYLSERERSETDFRFYTELMSRREESDSNLRLEMFKSILENFLKPVNDRSSEGSVLNLELLAYNFHDSLDLAPLFKEVSSQILSGNLGAEDKKRLQDRLDSVARQVKLKQISALIESGAKMDGSIYFADLNFHENTGEVTKGGEVFDKLFFPKLSEGIERVINF